MPTIPSDHADRWRVLLADHRALQDELIHAASFKKPLSQEQIEQMRVSAARLERLSKQVLDLVDEWSASHA